MVTFTISLTTIGVIVVLLALWYLVYSLFAFKMHNSLKGKVILVTGCDTGFGNLTAKQLDKSGCIVFATCLNQKTRDQLNKATADNVKTYIMDVTNTTHIRKIYRKISLYCLKNKTYLYGIVNNAGIAEFSPFECIPPKLFNKVIEVNLFGVTNVCREMLPLMRHKKYNPFLSTILHGTKLFGLLSRGKAGRIINIASVAGRISSPYLSAYHASKHGVVGFSDSIRSELQKFFNIWVSTVEPSFTHTPMVTKGFDCQSYSRKWTSISYDSSLGNLISRRNSSESDSELDDESTAQLREELNKELIEENKLTGNGNGNIFEQESILDVYDIDNWIKYMEDSKEFTFSICDKPENVVNCIVNGLSSVFPLRWYYPNWQAKILTSVLPFAVPHWIHEIIVDKKFFTFKFIK